MLPAKDISQITQILKEELIPALGCTEPIAVAFCAATARTVLGCTPTQITVQSSGNIIKNVKGVTVPGTGGLRGMEIATAIGVVAGDETQGLKLLTGVTPAQVKEAKSLVDSGFCTVELLDSTENLHLIVTAKADGHTALVEIQAAHTNIVRVEKDGQLLTKADTGGATTTPRTDRSVLTIAKIIDYIDQVDLDTVRPILEEQIACNTAISTEGLTGDYGVGLGKRIVAQNPTSISNRARGAAAAGSDARMSGCTLPVVINSGSGNQGLTVSLPVIIYGRELGVSHDQLLRALLLSNLVSIHIKTGIGQLSAFCGAVSAACGSGTAITYLQGGDLTQMEQTISNTLASVAGIVCDGAKPSCAAKINSALESAILSSEMALENSAFAPGEGIVKDSIEKTIAGTGRLANPGMHQTDRQLLTIMLEN